MKSYATAERIGEKYFRAEVELIPIEKSMAIDFMEKQTIFINCETALYSSRIKEGDVLIVEHDNETIQKIYGKDAEEKERRILVIKDLLK